MREWMKDIRGWFVLVFFITVASVLVELLLNPTFSFPPEVITLQPGQADTVIFCDTVIYVSESEYEGLPVIYYRPDSVLSAEWYSYDSINLEGAVILPPRYECKKYNVTIISDSLLDKDGVFWFGPFGIRPEMPQGAVLDSVRFFREVTCTHPECAPDHIPDAGRMVKPCTCKCCGRK